MAATGELLKYPLYALGRREFTTTNFLDFVLLLCIYFQDQEAKIFGQVRGENKGLPHGLPSPWRENGSPDNEHSWGLCPGRASKAGLGALPTPHSPAACGPRERGAGRQTECHISAASAPLPHSHNNGRASAEPAGSLRSPPPPVPGPHGALRLHQPSNCASRQESSFMPGRN